MKNSFFSNFFKSSKTTGDDAALLEKVEVTPGLVLSRAIADKWPDIEKTEKEYIKITATPADDISPAESHFGYYPYLPAGFIYPTDEKGNPMVPLAQLNFAEMPLLNSYPERGLLQFYVADSDTYGLDFENPFNPKSFRVVYHEYVEGAEQHNAFIEPLLEKESSPVFKPHRLTFSHAKEYIGIGDVNYEQKGSFNIEEYIKEARFKNIANELETEMYDNFIAKGHKVGGYAYFTQTDPRSYNTDLKDYILLFQMDSDDHIMWGDVGVGNFFIRPGDLTRKDFSHVLYNWDCS